MSNDNWELVAQAIDDIVEGCGDVIVTTRAELFEAIQEKDSRLKGCCSETVFEYLTLCLKRRGLTSRPYGYGSVDRDILLIWREQKMTELKAREKVKSRPLSETVYNALFKPQRAAASV